MIAFLFNNPIIFRETLGRISLVVLLILVGSIPLSGISQSFAEAQEIPDWVKTTLTLWSNGEITNEEFVTAIDYLSEKGIVEISSTSDKEIQRQVEYLKAKSEVFNEEVKELRDENEEYRILLKSQELNRENQYPTSMSSIFDDYQLLQKEVKSLRETNKRMSKNIDAWVSNFQNPEIPISSNSNNAELVKIKSETIQQLNNLKIENKKFEDKIEELKNSKVSYENNIELLKLENQNKKQLISVLKERNQENRDSVNQLVQNEQAYEDMISQLKNESFVQKQKMIEYEEEIKSFGETFDVINNEQTQNEQTVNKLENQNSGHIDAINKLEGINEGQKIELIAATNDLIESNKIVGMLSEQIQDYESTIKSFEKESVLYQNKIKQIGSEKIEYQEKISQLELENTEQRKTLIGIMNESQESNEFTSILNSRLVDFQEIVNKLENENVQYKSTIYELENENIAKNTSLITMKNDIDELKDMAERLNSKIVNYENTIQILEKENTMFRNDMTLVQDENTSKHESLIRQLQGENNDQQDTITMMKVEAEESNDLVTILNSKIVGYEKQISLFKIANSKYRNEITSLKSESDDQHGSSDIINSVIDEGGSMIKLLTEENTRHQNTIEELKDENKILEKKVGIATNESEDGLIMMSEIESENEEMQKQVELLKSEIKQKHEQIDTLKNIQIQKDAEILEIQAQESQVSMPVAENNTVNSIPKQNDVLLVELNYLKAKNLVNDDEIKTLRGENEEYRILFNLLKKGQDSTIGINNANYDTINENDVQGVVMYKTTEAQKDLPSDWIVKVDNSKKYSVYIENVPSWSKDVSSKVSEALEYWEETAGVEFEIVSTPSFGIISIGWEKELRNGYDGYVVGQTDVSIGLGSSDCDNIWMPYNSESIKNILVHELGHTVGLEHAMSKTNIMYPMIHDAKFEGVDQSISIPQDSSVFIRGCSFSADPAYDYQVKVKDSKNVDIFFVPSIKEKYKVDAGEAFDYYSDINCIGLDKSSKAGVCKVADSAGMLIINSDNTETVSLKVHLEEQ